MPIAVLLVASAVATTLGQRGASAAARPLRVVAVGDVACAPGEASTATQCRHADVAALVQRLRPRALLLPGDIQYDRGELSAYRRSFGPAFAELRDIWRPAPGNHEYGTAGAAGYYDFFGSKAGPGRRGWYSFDLGAWHVVSLNSNCDEVGCARDSRQVRWLRADLRRSRATCTMAFLHHPLASSGSHGGNPEVGALWHELDRAGAELAIAGHDHLYEWFAPLGSSGRPKRGGVRQFVVGTGGRSLYRFGEPQPGSIARESRFGALALDLGEGGFSWRFIDVEGATRDRGEAHCR